MRFEIVPGGHLGMLTGRAARDTTWRALDEWFEQWSGKREAARKPPRRRRPPRSRARQEGAAADTIGTNPTRRYGSGSSRALSPRT